MRKLIVLISLLFFSISENCSAETRPICLERRSITSSSHGPSRSPIKDSHTLVALYNDETNEIVLCYSIPGQHFVCSIWNTGNDYSYSEEGDFGENGTYSIYIDTQSNNNLVVTVNIGNFIYEGEVSI